LFTTIKATGFYMNSVETVIMAEEYLIGNTISNQQKQA
jgi:hypothetical protein